MPIRKTIKKIQPIESNTNESTAKKVYREGGILDKKRKIEERAKKEGEFLDEAMTERIRKKYGVQYPEADENEPAEVEYDEDADDTEEYEEDTEQYEEYYDNDDDEESDDGDDDEEYDEESDDGDEDEEDEDSDEDEEDEAPPIKRQPTRPSSLPGKKFLNFGSVSQSSLEDGDQVLVTVTDTEIDTVEKGQNGPWERLRFICETTDPKTKKKLTLSHTCGVSTGPKSKAYQAVKAIMGQDPEGQLDLDQLVGRKVWATIEKRDDNRGNVWDNISAFRKYVPGKR